MLFKIYRPFHGGFRVIFKILTKTHYLYLAQKIFILKIWKNSKESANVAMRLFQYYKKHKTRHFSTAHLPYIVTRYIYSHKGAFNYYVRT